jgi:hypothetical protein
MSQQFSNNHNYADNYIGSAWPYLRTLEVPSGDAFLLELPTVSRFLTIQNLETATDGTRDIFISFRPDGFVANPDDDELKYFRLKAGMQLPRMEIKCMKIWLKTSGGSNVNVTLFAGVTNMKAHQFTSGIIQQ